MRKKIKGKGYLKVVPLTTSLKKISKSKNPPHAMSTNPNTLLFEIDDKDDPAIIQVRENLMVAEQVQQEMVEQRRLERGQQQTQAEAERLRGEIKEVERMQRDLEEVELRMCNRFTLY